MLCVHICVHMCAHTYLYVCSDMYTQNLKAAVYMCVCMSYTYIHDKYRVVILHCFGLMNYAYTCVYLNYTILMSSFGSTGTYAATGAVHTTVITSHSDPVGSGYVITVAIVTFTKLKAQLLSEGGCYIYEDNH